MEEDKKGRGYGVRCWKQKNFFVCTKFSVLSFSGADTWRPGETNDLLLHPPLLPIPTNILKLNEAVFYIDGLLFELLRYLLPYR